MSASQSVESYRFWDVVTQWARESLEHEQVVARALARGIVRDGLRFKSVDTKWLKPGKTEDPLLGYPYVGYCAKPEGQLVVLKAEVLEHLLAIVERAEIPAHDLLQEMFVSREDFRNWLQQTQQKLPVFWFGVT